MRTAMASKTCPHCAEEIKPTARICPQCRTKIETNYTAGEKALGLATVGTLGGLVWLLLNLMSPTPPHTPNQSSQPPPEAYVHPTVTAAQDFLRQQQRLNQATIRAMQQARDAGKPGQAIPILEKRHRELLVAIAEVDAGIRSGRFHKDDRTTLLEPL